MTTTETPFMAATRQGQERYLRFWTDAMQWFFSVYSIPETRPPGTMNAEAPSVPTAEEVVDHAFDYGCAVLDIQRAYVKGMLAANKSIGTNEAWTSKGADGAATS